MPVRVVQITDCHLFEAQDGRLLGMNTHEGLVRVLDLVKKDPAYEVVLCTGDLVQDASVAGYKRFRSMIESLGAPQYWIPGNHDVRANMVEATKGTSILNTAVLIGGWQIILLDSTIEGAVPGFMKPETLEFLDKKLSSGKNLHNMVFLHHQPIPIGAQWLDNLGVQNADAFLKIIDRHASVRAVVWGHVHQQFESDRKGVEYIATPSTCVQFTPNSDDFAVDNVAPGYRSFTLHRDGRFETQVTRVEAFDFQIDYSIKGY